MGREGPQAERAEPESTEAVGSAKCETITKLVFIREIPQDDICSRQL